MTDDASTILVVEDDDATRSYLADNLSALWPLADRLGTAPLDPLDDRLLDRLERQG